MPIKVLHINTRVESGYTCLWMLSLNKDGDYIAKECPSFSLCYWSCDLVSYLLTQLWSCSGYVLVKKHENRCLVSLLRKLFLVEQV